MGQCIHCRRDDQAVRNWRKSGCVDMTIERYRQMASEQGGRCAICRQTEANGTRLAVDHDHNTGRARGLLCAKCNQGLGLFDEDSATLRAAADYTERFRAGDQLVASSEAALVRATRP